MVASNCCCDSKIHQFRDGHAFIPRKRPKTSRSQDGDSGVSVICIGDIVDGVSSSGCLEDDRHCPYSSRDPNESVGGSHVPMEGSSNSTNCAVGVPDSCGGVQSIVGNGYVQPYAQLVSVSGWMYVNECGQMCGPYIQEQLYEGLSTGFLPEDLPVYPIVNGALSNSVPLKYLRQFPEHVATGFAFWNTNSTAILSGEPTISNSSFNGDMASNGQVKSTECDATSAVHNISQLTPSLVANYNSYGYQPQYSSSEATNPASSSAPFVSNVPQVAPSLCVNDTSHGCEPQSSNAEATNLALSGAPMSSEESCWVFEDEEKRKRGPHSLSELYSWHHYGYLQDSLMIYHMDNKFQPFTLLSMVNAWRTDRHEIMAPSDIHIKDPSSPVSFINKISGEVSNQLHSGIMKAARRVVLDEIVSSIISDFVATKKAQRHLKPEITREAAKTDALGDKEAGIVGEKNRFISRDAIVVSLLSNQLLPNELSKESHESTKSVSSTRQLVKTNPFADNMTECVREKKNCVTSSDVITTSALCDQLKPVRVPSEDAGTVEDKTEVVREKKTCVASSDVMASSPLRDQLTPVTIPLEHLRSVKSVGDYENFTGALAITRRVFFDYCMQVMWNAVFHDPVSKYSSSWRKRKRWSDCPILPSTVPIMEESMLLKDMVERRKIASEQCVQDASIREDEYPPGFGPAKKSSNIQSHRSLSVTSQVYENIAEVKESVENALHLSVQLLISEYFKNFVDEEVMKSTGSAFGNETNEDDNHASKFFHQTSPHDSLDDPPELRVKVPGVSGESSSINDVQTDAQPLEVVLHTTNARFEGLQSAHLVNPFERLGFPITDVDNTRESDEPPPPGSEVNAFERLGIPITDVDNTRESDEPPPPGTEDSSILALPSQNAKLKSSKSDEYVPKMSEYVSLAICRQKLHDDVLKEWRSFFANDALRRCYRTWLTSRKQNVSEEGTVRTGKRKIKDSPAVAGKLGGKSQNCSSTGVSLVNGNTGKRKIKDSPVVPGKFSERPETCNSPGVSLVTGNTGKRKLKDSPAVRGKLRERTQNCNSSGASLVIGNYTYSRKKKSGRKKLGSLSQCMAVKDSMVLSPEESGDQQFSAAVSEAVELEAVHVNPTAGNKVKDKKLSSIDSASECIIVNRPVDDFSSLMKTTTDPSKEIAYVVQGSEEVIKDDATCNVEGFAAAASSSNVMKTVTDPSKEIGSVVEGLLLLTCLNLHAAPSSNVMKTDNDPSKEIASVVEGSDEVIKDDGTCNDEDFAAADEVIKDDETCNDEDFAAASLDTNVLEVATDQSKEIAIDVQGGDEAIKDDVTCNVEDLAAAALDSNVTEAATYPSKEITSVVQGVDEVINDVMICNVEDFAPAAPDSDNNSNAVANDGIDVGLSQTAPDSDNIGNAVVNNGIDVQLSQTDVVGDCSNKIPKSTKESRLKRKLSRNEPTGRPEKVMKLTGVTAGKKSKNKQFALQKVKSTKSRKPDSCPISVGCARCSISGWDWRKWSMSASPSDRARARGTRSAPIRYLGSDANTSQISTAKGLSARTNRVKFRSLLAAAEGADLLKVNSVEGKKKASAVPTKQDTRLGSCCS